MHKFIPFIHEKKMAMFKKTKSEEIQLEAYTKTIYTSSFYV